MHVGLVDLLWEGHHTPYVVYLTRYFAERGHRVTFITDERHPRLDELPEDPAVTVRALSVPTTDADPMASIGASLTEQWVAVRQLRRVLAVARETGVDVLHLLSLDRLQLPLWVTTGPLGETHPPIVATLHRDAFTDSDGGGLPKRLTHSATRRALSATLTDGSLASLTVHADTIRDRIVATVPGATPGNTRTIPAPTPPATLDVSRRAAREHLDLPVEAPLALFFGGLRAEKGPDLLADAVQDLDRPLTVVYAGSGDDFTNEDVRAWQRRAPSSVSIVDRVGFVPEADVEYYFRAADLLVLPYRRRRGISGPLRRACVAGTPIVANDGSDIGAIVEGHDLGWTYTHDSVTSLRETLVTALEAGESRTDQLRAYADAHHWRATGQAIETIYEELLGVTHTPAGSVPAVQE